MSPSLDGGHGWSFLLLKGGGHLAILGHAHRAGIGGSRAFPAPVTSLPPTSWGARGHDPEMPGQKRAFGIPIRPSYGVDAKVASNTAPLFVAPK